MPQLRLELTGQKFGRWTVIGFAHKDKHLNTYWLCRCECGEERAVGGAKVKRGETKSCGCLQREELIKRCTTHGHTGSRIYEIWRAMLARCENPNHVHYHCYGGRGITICKKWMKFENFLEDMGEPPTNKHQIDRINNDGNYNKNNCEWVTPKQNSRNSRSNRLIEFDGKTQCISAWAEELDMNYNTLLSRLNRWSIAKSLTQKVSA